MKNFCNLLHYRADTVDNIKKYKSFHPLAGSEYDRLLSIYYYASGMNCSYSIITMEHILIDINVSTWLLRCVFANAIKTINRLHQTFTTYQWFLIWKSSHIFIFWIFGLLNKAWKENVIFPVLPHYLSQIHDVLLLLIMHYNKIL